MNPINFEVGDRLLVSPWNKDKQAFDDGVFEFTIIEFSPSKMYVRGFLTSVDAWFPSDMLKVREKLEPQMGWSFEKVETNEG